MGNEIGYDLSDSPPHDLLSHLSKLEFWFDISGRPFFAGAASVANTRQEWRLIPALTNPFFLNQRKP